MKQITICLLFIISFLIMAGCIYTTPINNSTINNTVTPSILPVNPGFLVYTNNTYNFSIEYPANWNIVEGVRDEYSNSPASVTYVVTFYPRLDNGSSKYDCLMVAIDYDPLHTSQLTLQKYLDYGIKQYYQEFYLPISYGRSFTNVSNYSAVEASYSYYENNINLRGRAFFIIVTPNSSESSNYPIVYRLVYRAKNDTYNIYFDDVQRILNTFKLYI